MKFLFNGVNKTAGGFRHGGFILMKDFYQV